MGQDLIIGSITDYSYEQIEPWVNSIERSGFNGVKAIIAYNCKADVVEKLKEKDFTIFAFEQDENGDYVYNANKETFSIVVERFAHMWYFISQIDNDIDYVIATDVKDVVFQTNPSDYLDDMLLSGKTDVIVASENFLYKDEPWNVNNMNYAFGPTVYQKVMNKPIYCAGVIAGRKDAVLDLFLSIFMLCRGTASKTPGGGGPDQAALNVLLSTYAWNNIARYETPETNWCCHLGTTLSAVKSGAGEIGQHYLRDPSTLDKFTRTALYDDVIIDENDVVCNKHNRPYCIIHQYDRVNGLKEKIERKYR